MPRLLAVTALVACALALAAILREPTRRSPPPAPPTVVEVTPTPSPRATKRRKPQPKILWRRSRALGTPSAGRLIRAVRLPARGEHYITWDPVYKRVPNRWTRRNGTDDLVRTLLNVAGAYARRHPGAPRIVVGDLSRPRGGDFGRRFGPVGHASHQNGLDADVYFPRRDRLERAPWRLGQVDRERAQELVDRFVEAGAEKVFVGPGLKLSGPPSVVQPWPNHDDHLHVRLRPSGR